MSIPIKTFNLLLGSQTVSATGNNLYVNGQLVKETGFYYPLNANPSGYITSSQTGGFITTGQTGNFVLSSQTGSFITTSQTGQFYAASNPNNYIPYAAVGGVQTVNVTGSLASGALVLTGLSIISITRSGQNIYISGDTSSFALASQTGSFITTGQTGQFAPAGLTGSFITTSQTGQFYPYSNPYGFLSGASVGGVRTLNVTGLLFSGAVTLTGAGDVAITYSGQIVTISGGTGYYPFGSNPSGYVTGSVVRPTDTGNFVDRGQTGSFITTGQTGNFVLSSQTGSFITTSQTGVFATAANLALTGSSLASWTGISTGLFYPLTSNPSGYVTGSVVRPTETGSFITTSQTGGFITTGQTGQFYAASNPNGYLTAISVGGVRLLNVTGFLLSGNLALTGLGGITLTTGGTGIINISGDNNFVRPSSTGSFITAIENVGAGYGLVSGLLGPNYKIRSLANGDNLSIASGSNQLTISLNSNIALNQVSVGAGGISAVSGGTAVFPYELTASELFEVSNLANGDSYFIFNSGVEPAVYYLQNTGLSAKIDMQGRTISGFSIDVRDPQTLKINNLLVINSGANIGTGSGLFTQPINNYLAFKSLVGGNGIRISGDASNLYIIATGNPSGFLTGTNLGNATDGTYGPSTGPIAGVAIGDRPEDAFDKIEVILAKLAPSKPQNLSAATFAFSNTTYSALEQGTSGTRTSVIASFFPTGAATGFYDGDIGTLSAYISGVVTGQKVLSTGSDTGNFTGLKITADVDYWSGVAGRAGFWTYLNASVSPTGSMRSGIFNMQLIHSVSGPTATITGYCDAPATPSVTVLTVTTGACTTRIIDGVSGLASADPINVGFQLSNVVSAFYRNPIAVVSSSQTASTNVNSTGTPFSGTTLTLTGVILTSASAYTTGLTPSVLGYNSASVTSSNNNIVSSIIIDTASTQPANRVTAGTGRYPTNSQFGAPYDNTTSLVFNEEMQMINGAIQHPPKNNYSTRIPVGPNYTAIQTGNFSGYRWACFNLGYINDWSAMLVTITGAAGFGASDTVSNLQLFAKVSGTNPTNGWIDANTAYPGVGQPTNNGDPALDVSDASTTATVKRITFGTTRNGTGYLRIGFPSGDSKTFSSIGMIQG